MGKASEKRERRKYPRFFIDLPLEYCEEGDSRLKGGVTVNASERGLLFESVKAIPLGTKLNVSVFFPRGFELADLKLEAEIVWKEPLLKEEWEGYQYGLNIVQFLGEGHWKLRNVLNGQFSLDAIDTDEGREVTGSQGQAVTIPTYKILVVDDEEEVRQLLVKFLSQRGHQCQEATDGADALHKAVANGFDAIITDIVMPKMDGVTLTKQLLKRSPKLPIMVMTGHSNEFSSVTAMASGAREFIKKPFSLIEFATRFDKMMMNAHKIPVENEGKQDEKLFRMQRASLEENERLKKQVENLTERLNGGHPRFKMEAAFTVFTSIRS
jgi:CheY-like chemotaxis protein